MTLRAKLLAALAPLAAILVLFAWASTAALSRLGSSPDLILRDNYRSVLAAERMMESLEQLQDGGFTPFTEEAVLAEVPAQLEGVLRILEGVLQAAPLLQVDHAGAEAAAGPLQRPTVAVDRRHLVLLRRPYVLGEAFLVLLDFRQNGFCR